MMTGLWALDLVNDSDISGTGPNGGGGGGGGGEGEDDFTV